jgi:hypothetical protein
MLLQAAAAEEAREAAAAEAARSAAAAASSAAAARHAEAQRTQAASNCRAAEAELDSVQAVNDTMFRYVSFRTCVPKWFPPVMLLCNAGAYCVVNGCTGQCLADSASRGIRQAACKVRRACTCA